MLAYVKIVTFTLLNMVSMSSKAFLSIYKNVSVLQNCKKFKANKDANVPDQPENDLVQFRKQWKEELSGRPGAAVNSQDNIEEDQEDDLHRKVSTKI